MDAYKFLLVFFLFLISVLKVLFFMIFSKFNTLLFNCFTASTNKPTKLLYESNS